MVTPRSVDWAIVKENWKGSGYQDCVAKQILVDAHWQLTAVQADWLDRLWIIGTGDMICAFGRNRVRDVSGTKPSNAKHQNDIDLHWNHVAKLTQEFEERGEFPPLTVAAAREDGPMFLADGNHRAIALHLLGRLLGQSAFLGIHPRMTENGYGCLAWKSC